MKKKEREIRFRTKEQYLIPFISIDIQKKLPIKEIVFSPLCQDPDIVTMGIERLLQEKGYLKTRKEISIRKSSVSLRY